MLKSYIKIALRSLLKNKVYSVINILGLSAGLACCVLILLHVQDEFSYDTFYENEENLYRVALERVYPEHVNYFALIPSGFSEAFVNEIPEVKKSTRLLGFPNFTNTVEYADKVFEENYIFFADSNFFDILDFKILQGDPLRALSNPGTIIVTESTAQKYFGDDNPIGKTLTINGNDSEVVGLMQDIPDNSHIRFDFLSSSTNLGLVQQPNYTGFSSYTYIELTDGTDPAVVESKIPPVVTKYASGQIERNLGISYEEYQAAGNGYNYFLQPISDIHLHSNLEAEIKPNGNITYVYIFISIAVFILLIACINFVNLATARSGERAREVGVRKVMGSDRKQLIRQFLTESVLVSFFSMLFAFALIQVALPFFNELANKDLSLYLFDNGLIFLILIGFTFFIGLLAGLYPAFYISSLSPVQVMKGKFHSSAKGKWLRNGLVVLQFSISIVLIASTMIVNDQMDFIQNKRLGFDKENVLIVENIFNLEQPEAFKQELRNLAEITSVGATSALPGDNFFGIQLQRPGNPEVFTGKGVTVDDHFIETMKINILEGRAFSEKFNDSLKVILNEAAVQAFGIEDPVGETVTQTNQVDGENVVSEYEIIGVAENFNFESLRVNITPLVILSSESSQGFENYATARFSTDDFKNAISSIEKLWNSFSTNRAFNYTFLDDDLAEMYEAEQTSGLIFAIFAALAIFIACVGLFGLAAYSSFQRTKEIGVRKVLGATVTGIVLLLSKDFTKLVGIAFIVAAPISYFAMQNWLQNFAFRVDISILTLIIAGVISLVVAILTISYQAISAAVVNPVKSLHTE